MHRSAQRVRFVAGLLFWILAIWLTRAHIADPTTGKDRHALRVTADYLWARSFGATLVLPERAEIAIGDPIYLQRRGSAMVRAGEVRRLWKANEEFPYHIAGPQDGVTTAEIVLETQGSGAVPRVRAKLITVPQTAAWILRTLLPPEKLEILAREWNETLLTHRDEVFASLNPLITRFVLTMEEVVIAALPAAIEARRAELSALGTRLHEEVIRKELTPLLRDQLWPVIEERTRPTLTAIQDEMLKKIPVWGITWRLLYDKLPLTQQNALRRELDRFWQVEAAPILKAHAEDFLAIAQDVVKEAAKNPEVGAAFRRGFDRLVQDGELKHEARHFLQATVLDNPRFHEAMRELWASPEFSRAVDGLSRFLEPFARRMGDLVLGTRGGGITPEFARVLRSQILEKDRRWILLEEIEASAGGEPLGPGARIGATVEQEAGPR